MLQSRGFRGLVGLHSRFSPLNRRRLHHPRRLARRAREARGRQRFSTFSAAPANTARPADTGDSLPASVEAARRPRPSAAPACAAPARPVASDVAVKTKTLWIRLIGGIWRQSGIARFRSLEARGAHLSLNLINFPALTLRLRLIGIL